MLAVCQAAKGGDDLAAGQFAVDAEVGLDEAVG